MAEPSSSSRSPADLFARPPIREGLHGQNIKDCFLVCEQKPTHRFDTTLRLFYNPYARTAFFRLRVELELHNTDGTITKGGTNTGYKIQGTQQSKQKPPIPTLLYLDIRPEGISRLTLQQDTLTFRFGNSHAVQLIAPQIPDRFHPSTATDALAALGFFAVHSELGVHLPSSALEKVRAPLTALCLEINRYPDGHHRLEYMHSRSTEVRTLYRGQGGRVVDVKQELLPPIQQTPVNLAPPAYASVSDARIPLLPGFIRPQKPQQKRRHVSSSSESDTSNHDIVERFDPTGEGHSKSSARVLRELEEKLQVASKLMSEIQKEKGELQREKADIKALTEQNAEQASRWIDLMDSESSRLMALIEAAKKIPSCTSCSAAAASADSLIQMAQEGEQKEDVMLSASQNASSSQATGCTAFTDSQDSETATGAAKASSPPLPPFYIRHYIETQLALVRADIPTDCASHSDVKDEIEGALSNIEDDITSTAKEVVAQEAERLRDRLVDALQEWPL